MFSSTNSGTRDILKKGAKFVHFLISCQKTKTIWLLISKIQNNLVPWTQVNVQIIFQ